ncbi:hypothetical protein BS47DRAFT_1286838, partial [Hydnum rufescens UP504]
TKHIHICYHYTCQLISEGHISITYCPSEDMIANILTKNLNHDLHWKFTRALGLIPHLSGSVNEADAQTPQC